MGGGNASRQDTNGRFTVACRECGKPSPAGYHPFCSACDHLVEVTYDLARTALHDSSNPFRRFADLLPVADPSVFPENARPTPCVHARTLGARLGLPWLFLKDETVLPTGTTKDRMAPVALAYLRERGVRHICTSSTGNSSTAFAKALRSIPDLRVYLFTAEDFVERVDSDGGDRLLHFGMRGATFVEAFQCAGAFAQRNKFTSERGFFNPGRREGLKLTFLEASDQVSRPIDWYVQAVSSAMGVYGTYKGAKELLALGKIDRLPRLLCVQQDTCNPMVRAFRDGSETIQAQHIVKRPTGIAKAILRGDPSRAYPYVREIVQHSRGGFADVSEAEIRDARRMVEELEGIRPCFSASTALAGLIRRVRAGDFPLGDTVLVNLTGSDRPAAAVEPEIHWLVRSGDDWIPEDASDPVGRSFWGEKGAPLASGSSIQAGA